MCLILNQNTNERKVVHEVNTDMQLYIGNPVDALNEEKGLPLVCFFPPARPGFEEMEGFATTI